MDTSHPDDQDLLVRILKTFRPAKAVHAVLTDLAGSDSPPPGISPDKVLTSFAISLILDLYNPDSTDSANLQRISGGFDHALQELTHLKKVIEALGPPEQS